jgi:hypothetical protein
VDAPEPSIDEYEPREGIERGPHYQEREESSRKLARARRRKRAWGVADYPVVGPVPRTPGSPPGDEVREVLLAVYEQVAATWRSLVDVRFKLLALVPAVSVIALSQVLKQGGSESLTTGAKLSIVAVGAVVTAGLWIYDTRNSELHDELISRARRIEAELGVHTGAFMGRPGPWHQVISHRSALGLVYGATLLGWVAAGVVVAT